MYARATPSPGLRRLAELQAGIVSREQAIGHGLSSKSVGRLVREEHWQRVAAGIYLTAPGPPDWTALAWAGVLLGGDRAGIGGAAAGYLHGIIDSPPATIPILIPHDVRRQDQPPWVFSRRRSDDRLHFRGSPPRSGVEDTVLDLCDAASADRVVTWLTAAVQQRRTTTTRLLRTLSDRPRQRHRALIMSLLGDVAAGAQSFLELRYLHDVERPHGLPPGRRQARSRNGRAIRDVLYDEYELVVELDGLLGHDGLGRFRDMWRDNQAVVDALLTLRYGSTDVCSRPCAVAVQVGSVLTARGWDGVLTRCRRCRLVPDELLGKIGA
jgi:putative AbiEi antitoxin of type IV toxin-antitoxin system